MRKQLLSGWLLLILLGAIPAYMQESQPSFIWEAAQFSLTPPDNWDAPITNDTSQPLLLEMAQALVDIPLSTRPPGIPFIRLELHPDTLPANQDLSPFLYAVLQALEITPTDGPFSVAWGDNTALILSGNSTDNTLYGQAWATALPDNSVLVMVGRAATAQQADFEQILAETATSLTYHAAPLDDATLTAEPSEITYGVLWHTLRDISDGDQGLLNLIGLQAGPNDYLYTYEADLGVVRVNRITGRIESITPNQEIMAASALAVAPDGSVYVGDTLCGCIYTRQPDGVWLHATTNDAELADPEAQVAQPETDETAGLITGFNIDAPAALAVSGEGILYATDFDAVSSAPIIKAFTPGRLLPSIIILDETVTQQPLLTTTVDGRVLALTTNGTVLNITGNQAEPLHDLGYISGQVVAFAATGTDQYVLALADQGVLLVDEMGTFVASLASQVDDQPYTGEIAIPAGVATHPDGTLYIADSDGTFGALTALRSDIPANRLGAMALIPGVEVQGQLSITAPQQQWTYTATTPQQITLAAVDNTSTGQLDVALRLLNTSGEEIAYNADHQHPDMPVLTDAFIQHQLQPGEYVVEVQSQNGTGTYTLGLTQTAILSINEPQSGYLGFAVPAAYWQLEAVSDQTITITLASDGTSDLDLTLRLYNPDGTLLAENDDADDPTLGLDAQLVNITLPTTGIYTLEAARYEGTGKYTLSVTAN